MIDKCKTCVNGYPSISCVNCGSGLRNYRPNTSTTNADCIRSMTDEKLAEFIDGNEYIGCKRCSVYGTHHADKSNIGTEYEYLYEYSGCEFENGIVGWLQQPVEEDKS